jgi:uncharacterized membrane protein
MATLLGVVILQGALTASGMFGMVLILIGLALQARTWKLSATSATTPV